MRLRHRLPPQSRLMQSIPSWVAPGALLAMQFGPDRYWRKQGGLLPATSVLTTTRSSNIVLPDSAGVFQTLGNDTLPRTDLGLYVNGQSTNLLRYSQDFSNAAWIKVSGVTVETNVAPAPDGTFTADRVLGLSDAAGERLIQNVTLSPTTVTGSIFLKGEGTDIGKTVRVYTKRVGGPSAQSPVQTITLTGGWQRVVNGTFTMLSENTGAGLYILRGDESNYAASCLVWGGQLEVGDFSGPYIATTTAAEPLFASDIRAVQGVRPSNGQPEPFPGWEAAGLDDAMAGKAVVNIDRLNASAARFIAGVDADNLWRLIFDTDNRFKLIVRKSGVDEVSLQTGAVAATGDKTIEWQAKPGDYAIAATGVAGDTDSDGATLPAGATTLRVGSNFGVLNPFNGWISEIQIARAA